MSPTAQRMERPACLPTCRPVYSPCRRPTDGSTPLLEDQCALHALLGAARSGLGVEYGFMFVDTHVGRAGAFERHGGDAAQLLHDLGQVEHRNADATLDLLAAECEDLTLGRDTDRSTCIRGITGIPAAVTTVVADCLRFGQDIPVPQNHRDSGNGRLCIPHGTVTLNPSRETTAVPERECIEFTIELLRPGHLVSTVVILSDRSERIDGMRILNELSVTDDGLNCGTGRRYTDQVYVPAAVQTFELLNRLKIGAVADNAHRRLRAHDGDVSDIIVDAVQLRGLIDLDIFGQRAETSRLVRPSLAQQGIGIAGLFDDIGVVRPAVGDHQRPVGEFEVERPVGGDFREAPGTSSMSNTMALTFMPVL